MYCITILILGKFSIKFAYLFYRNRLITDSLGKNKKVVNCCIINKFMQYLKFASLSNML